MMRCPPGRYRSLQRFDQREVDDDHLRILREIAMGSVLAVPLSASDVILGTLVFVNHEGDLLFRIGRVTSSEISSRNFLLWEHWKA